MFRKVERTDSELTQMELELDASMKKAEKYRQIQLNIKVQKIKNHLKHVENLRNKSVILDERNAIEIDQDCDLKAEIATVSNLIQLMEKSKKFDDFQVLMQQKDIIASASKLTSFLERELLDNERILHTGNGPKIFLSLMLIAKYPSEIMPNPNVKDAKLLIKAKALRENILVFFTPTVMYNKETHMKLALEWIHTMHNFIEWSTLDKFHLQTKMEKDFLNWVKKIGNWQQDHQSHAEWEPHVLVYLNQILEKYFEVFGEINTRKLIEEVQLLNETFPKADLIIEFDTSKNLYYCNWKDREKTPEAAKNKNAESIGNTNTLTDLEIDDSNVLSNIKILHELMISEEGIDFEKLLDLSGTSIEKLSALNLNRLDALVSLFGTDNSSEKILIILKEIFNFIRVSMMELVGKNDDYRQEISMMDCTITQHDWLSDSVHLFTNVIQMCKKCCAPIRDKMCEDIENDISSIINTEIEIDSIPIFKRTFLKIFDLLNYMKSDCCNFKLRLLAANIEGKGIAEKYELENFCSNYSQCYPKTLKWLKSTIKANRSKTAKVVLIEGFLSLLDLESLNETNTIPETFYLDEERIERFKNELKLEISKDAAIVYVKNCAREQSSKYFDRDDLLENIESQIKSIMSFENLNTTTYELLDSIESNNTCLFKGRLECLFENPLNDKVFMLLKNRYLAEIRSSLNKNRSESSEEIVRKICKLLKYNMSCFGPIYDEVILNETQK